MQDSATSLKRRPWLPLRHVVGLVAVFVFIVGGVAGGWFFLLDRDAKMSAEAAEWEAKNTDELYASMSFAMLDGDREAFINWGEGEAREKLARIWDESKKVGWTIGIVDSVYSDEESEHVLSDDFEFDPSDPYPGGMLIAFDLGFTTERFPEGVDVGCTADLYDCGILTQVFRYDVTVDGGDGNSNSHRITELTPRTPMPWDDPAGVHAVHRDNTVVFGYADEAARIDAVADDVQDAAEAVLQTVIATSGYATVPGFPMYITDDPERWSHAIYGAGEHARPADRDWTEAGIAVVSPSLNVFHGATDRAQELGLNLSLGGQGGTLPGINGDLVADNDGAIFRVAAHEFAHALEMTTFSHSLGLFSVVDPSAESAANSMGTEGYAVFVEDLVASPRDGYLRSLALEVSAAIVDASDSELAEMVTDEAFKSASSSTLAYNISGNYFAFMADSGVDLTEVMKDAEYNSFPPDVWIGFHFAASVTGDEDINITVDDWRAWNASRLEAGG